MAQQARIGPESDLGDTTAKQKKTSFFVVEISKMKKKTIPFKIFHY